MRRTKRFLAGSRRRRITTAVVASMLAVTAGLALAAVLQDSEGEGTVKVKDLAKVTIARGTAPNEIARGGDGAASIKVTNPLDVAVQLSAVSPPTAVTGDTTVPACAFTNLTVNGLPSLSISVPANSTDFPVSVPNAYHLSAAAPSDCSGATLWRSLKATFTIP